jgi:CelD/BcsL family acetyltransferase involved in cellulose biosynthesis
VVVPSGVMTLRIMNWGTATMLRSAANKQPQRLAHGVLTTEGISVRVIDVADIDSEFANEWLALEKSSSEGNVFLSPHFVLPAVHRLEQATPPLIVAVEDTNSANRLIGLGVFDEAQGSRQLPLAHLQAWRCDYSLFVGLLIDRVSQDAVLDAFFSWLKRNADRWHGLAMRDHASDTELALAMNEAAARHGLEWCEDWSNERAAIRVASIPDDLMSLYSKSRRKTIKKSMRKLEQHGHVTYTLEKRGKEFKASLETFFRLESLGWKGDKGTAMISQPSHAQFGFEMAKEFAQDDRLVMGELKVDNATVASTLNLISGDTLFALKIGWDPQYADASPGTLSEFQLLKNVASLDGVTLVDSCAKTGSYVENIWPWRKRLSTGVYTSSKLGSLAAGMMQNVKSIKRWLKQLR